MLSIPTNPPETLPNKISWLGGEYILVNAILFLFLSFVISVTSSTSCRITFDLWSHNSQISTLRLSYLLHFPPSSFRCRVNKDSTTSCLEGVCFLPQLNQPIILVTSLGLNLYPTR